MTLSFLAFDLLGPKRWCARSDQVNVAIAAVQGLHHRREDAGLAHTLPGLGAVVPAPASGGEGVAFESLIRLVLGHGDSFLVAPLLLLSLIHLFRLGVKIIKNHILDII